MKRNVVDIVGKKCNNTYTMENELYPPTAKKTAVCKTNNKTFVQPDRPQTTAQ